MQYNATQRNATPRHATPRHATPRHATPRHATPRHATPRHATPHNTTQHNTTQHNTIQNNTIHVMHNATSYELSYNATKSFSLCFKSNLIKITPPSFVLGNHVIPAVDKWKIFRYHCQ